MSLEGDWGRGAQFSQARYRQLLSGEGFVLSWRPSSRGSTRLPGSLVAHLWLIRNTQLLFTQKIQSLPAPSLLLGAPSLFTLGF